MDVNLTYHGDHFTIYTYIESLGCTLKTKSVVCQLPLNKVEKITDDMLSQLFP